MQHCRCRQLDREPLHLHEPAPPRFPALVDVELQQARSRHGNQHSLHEGLAVLQEEVFELQLEVYKKARERDRRKVLEELVQVGAMAQRMAEDLGLLE
jgi:hypothetical protein